MANKFTDFLKNNKANAAFAALDLPAAVSGEHKLKGMLTLITNLALGTQIWSYQLSKAFSGIGSMVRGLITSTGALQAAMKKMGETQAAQKAFTSLGQTASGAMSEIKKLAGLSASKGLRFEEVSQAAISLVSLSRGARGTAADMSVLIDVSKATGASLQGLAEDVGGISDALRNGDAIDSAVDRLRSIGAISESAATSLKNLQKAGAGAFTIQGEMDSALGKTASRDKGGVAQAGKDSEVAKTGIAEAAGKPWVEGDVETTKNYTEALKAITPVVAELSGFFAAIYDRVARWTSAVVKAIAGSALFQVAIKGLVIGLTLLSGALTVVFGIKLTAWLTSATSGFARFTNGALLAAGKGLGMLSISAKAASRSMTVLRTSISLVTGALIALEIASVVFAVFALAAAAWDALSGSSENLTKELDDNARASRELNDELMLQANSIETLADKHALLQKALKASGAAWQEVMDQQQENDNEWFYVSDAGKQKLASKQEAARAVDKTATRIADAPVSEIVGMRHDVAKGLSEAQTARDVAGMSGSARQKVERDIEEARRLHGLANEGQTEIKEGRETDKEASKIQIRRAKAQAEDVRDGGPEKRAKAMAQAKEALAKAEAGIRDYGEGTYERNDSERRAKDARATIEKIGEGPDLSTFDRETADLYAGSHSDEKKGLGMQMQVALDRKANPNLSPEDQKALTDKHDKAQILIDKGKKASSEQLANADAADKKDEEIRQGKILYDSNLKLAELEAETAGSQAQGHEAFMQQSDQKLRKLEEEHAAYMKINRGVAEATDAESIRNSNAQKAERVAQAFATREHQKDLRHADSEKGMANDKSVGIVRAQRERSQEIADLKADLENSRENNSNEQNDAAQTKIDEAERRDRLATVEETKQQLATGRDIQNRHAAATGDASIIQKNQAVSEFQDVFDSVLQSGGDEFAAETLGRRAAQDSVNLQGIQMQQAANTSGAVSSLARIGGGGGVEAVDTQIDLMKISNDIQNAISATLVRIEEAKKGIKQ